MLTHFPKKKSYSVTRFLMISSYLFQKQGEKEINIATPGERKFLSLLSNIDFYKENDLIKLKCTSSVKISVKETDSYNSGSLSTLIFTPIFFGS